MFRPFSFSLVPETLDSGIMHHLRESGDASIDFSKNDIFATLRCTLDGEMKRLKTKPWNMQEAGRVYSLLLFFHYHDVLSLSLSLSY